jgi:Protein of unknown function (DUF2852)
MAGRPAAADRIFPESVLTAGLTGSSYVNVIYIDMGRAMDIVGKLDDIGKPAWIGVMVLGFIVFWPIGLAILAYLIWSGRMGCGRHGGRGRWYGTENREGGWSPPWRRHESSGNRAFDEYRAETLKRLEEEQREFLEFLERLRHAKDKAEFDDFMAERRRRGPQGPVTETQPEA